MPTFTPEQAAAHNLKWDANGKRRKLLAEGDRDALALAKEIAAGQHPSNHSPLARALAGTHEVRRIRQSHKPLLNKLETDWLARFRLFQPLAIVLSQAVRLRLATGAWYRPDHFYFREPVNHVTEKRVTFATAIECKGPKQVKGCSKGLLALKVAAKEYPQIHFLLVWREGGQWFEQAVLP